MLRTALLRTSLQVSGRRPSGVSAARIPPPLAHIPTRFNCISPRGQFRSFSSSAECSSGTDRHSVEGRYAHALMAAAQGSKALDAVYTDVEGLHAALQTSPEFGAFAETPGITAEVKIDVVQQMAERFRLHKITKQFLCTVAENKRMVDLPKILAAFDELYRKHRGEVRCTVTSAQGGLLVRMGDELLDFTVASRVEGLITSLQSPLTL
ncbi:ATP synthase delta subunit protein [Cyclospora cayetanensis]|uniref:ATP synthase delta subunit protein n=1 Tax=Cyclospora cayetanensis TaxID=88456 RepID=A0A1D3DB63_9EIME|nr:ATP synthase delta subunit protein [Cyclospora cayetanensis]